MAKRAGLALVGAAGLAILGSGWMLLNQTATVRLALHVGPAEVSALLSPGGAPEIGVRLTPAPGLRVEAGS